MMMRLLAAVVIGLTSIVAKEFGVSAKEFSELELSWIEGIGTHSSFEKDDHHDGKIQCEEKPSQLHLALSHDFRTDIMIVSWSNRCVRNSQTTSLRRPWRSVAGMKNRSYSVTFWVDGNRAKTERIARAETKKYFLSYHHHATLLNLKANTKYCYFVTGFKDAGSCFRTQALAGEEVNFVSLGDMGLNNSEGTMDAVLRNMDRYDFIMHGGDIAYGDDLGFMVFDTPAQDLKPGPEGYELIYDQYMDQISNFAKSVPYMVIPGNHDVTCNILGDEGLPGADDCDPGQRNFSAYRSRFKMPGNAQGMWYSFRVRNVYIIGMNTESDYPGAPTQPSFSLERLVGGLGGGFGDQVAWLEKDLQKAKRMKDEGKVDWILVFGHRQLYSSKLIDYPLGTSHHLRRAIEHLLLKYQVDLYTGAHIHSYERLYPMSDGSPCEPHMKKGDTIYDHPRCPVYTVNGAAGNCEGADGDSVGHDHRHTIKGVYSENGFASVKVNATHLHWTYNVTTDKQNYIGDEFYIIKT